MQMLYVRSKQRSPVAPRADSPESTRQALTRASGWYVCARCGATLAHESWVLDASFCDHLVFSNPHGKLFHLLLVTRCEGVVFELWATSEFTWFSGYAWRVGYCGSCQGHVGWRFEATRAAAALTGFVALSRAALRFVDRV